MYVFVVKNVLVVMFCMSMMLGSFVLVWRVCCGSSGSMVYLIRIMVLSVIGYLIVGESLVEKLIVMVSMVMIMVSSSWMIRV